MVVEGSDEIGLSDRNESRLQSLAAMLAKPTFEVHYHSYEQAEVAAEALAARLLERIDRRELAEHLFMPVPRGGFIVLGMLSYLLDLAPDQLVPHPSDDRPVVLVDDMALTGARLREIIDTLDKTDVVVAHLCSHPGLRHQVELDSRVRACIAGFDLPAMDDELRPDEKAAVRENWSQRLEGRFWSEPIKHAAFPWTEPEQILWDSDREAAEVGWRMVSPEHCLKNRGLLGPPAANRNARQFRFPSEMAFGTFDQGYLVCLLDSEEVYQLDAVSGAIWGALGTLGDVEDAGRYLSTLFDTEESTLTSDAAALSNQFLETGLLIRTTADP